MAGRGEELADALADEKARLRRRLSGRRRGVPAAVAEAAGRAVARSLLRAPELASARAVGLYAALADELPTRPLFDALGERGLARALPRIEAEGGLSLAWVDTWRELVPGRYRVPEPGPQARPTDLARLDVLIVPALAYDRRGARLGRGGGYYDRLLASAAGGRPFVVGIGYRFQLRDELPVGPHDERVDAIATEAGTLRARVRGWARGAARVALEKREESEERR